MNTTRTKDSNINRACYGVDVDCVRRIRTLPAYRRFFCKCQSVFFCLSPFLFVCFFSQNRAFVFSVFFSLSRSVFLVSLVVRKKGERTDKNTNSQSDIIYIKRV